MISGARGRRPSSTARSQAWRAFRAVGFATREKGWVVGGQGFVFRTLDGGATWARQISGIELPEAATARGVDGFDSVTFVDEQHGIIVGVGQTDEAIGVFGPNVIYRTERF